MINDCDEERLQLDSIHYQLIFCIVFSSAFNLYTTSIQLRQCKLHFNLKKSIFLQNINEKLVEKLFYQFCPFFYHFICWRRIYIFRGAYRLKAGNKGETFFILRFNSYSALILYHQYLLVKYEFILPHIID